MTAVNVSEAEAAVLETPVAGARKASASFAPAGGGLPAKPSGGTTEPLRTGDLVYFCGLEQPGLLQAEGFCTGRVGLQPLPHPLSAWAQHSPLPANMDECVFRLCPPLEYDMIEIAQSSGLKKQSSRSAEELELARQRAPHRADEFGAVGRRRRLLDPRAPVAQRGEQRCERRERGGGLGGGGLVRVRVRVRV